MPPGSPAEDLTSMHIARAARGDVSSQAALVAQFTPLLLAQARYRLRGAAGKLCEPEDLVQDVWAITLPRLPDLQVREGRWTPVLVKFLATTLLRCANHVWRRHAGARAEAPIERAPVDALPAECTGVITALGRRDRHDALLAAIQQLSPQEQEVLVLRGIEQQRNSDIAALLGIDDASVTRRWQKALASLRSILPESIVDELV